MCQAELGAIAAAITHSCSHIASDLKHDCLDSLTSLFVKYINNLFTLRSTNNTFKGRSSPCCLTWLKTCMLPLCRLLLLPRPSAFATFKLYQVYMTLVRTQLVGCIGLTSVASKRSSKPSL
eukprot:39914-Pelagomonas_calceolata.AAC.1